MKNPMRRMPWQNSRKSTSIPRMIPKTIYQTWVTKNIPSKVSDYISAMMECNPEYKHVLYDDSDIYHFVKEVYGSDVLKAYEMLNVGASKADFWRYLMLYEKGGIYLDMDSHIYNNLDRLIDDGITGVITRERNPNLFVQWCLMFAPKSSILEYAIEKCTSNILEKKTNDILYLTGPQVYSEAVRQTTSFLGVDVYGTPDPFINDKTQLKFYGYDYDGFAVFKHPNSYQLYSQQTEWRQTAQQKGVFKNNI